MRIKKLRAFVSIIIGGIAGMAFGYFTSTLTDNLLFIIGGSLMVWVVGALLLYGVAKEEDIQKAKEEGEDGTELIDV